MESVGARIKKLRLEKGLTLEDVHKKTNLHLSVLKAIEEDSLINLSPVYVRGFLKIYCNFLEVDLAQIMPDYTETKQPGVVTAAYQTDTQAESVSHLKVTASPFKPVSFKLPAINLPAMKLPTVKPKIIFGVALGFIVLLVLFNLGKSISSRKSLPRKADPAAAAVAKPVKKAVSSKTKKAAAAPKAQAPAAAPAPKKAADVPRPEVLSGVRLSILAKEDCWINLKSDGKVVFHGTLKKGRTETWQAKEKIELSVTNAGVINLEVNGRLITNLGRKGQALKNISITKDGLTVGQ